MATESRHFVVDVSAVPHIMTVAFVVAVGAQLVLAWQFILVSASAA